MFTKPLLAILALAVGASAGCKDCSLNKNGIWKGNCGAYFEESSNFGDWTPTLSRRRLEAGDEAGDKADFKKFLTAMQRQGRIEVGDQLKRPDQATRRLSECTTRAFSITTRNVTTDRLGLRHPCACGTDCSDCGGGLRAKRPTTTISPESPSRSTRTWVHEGRAARDKDDCCELNVGRSSAPSSPSGHCRLHLRVLQILPVLPDEQYGKETERP